MNSTKITVADFLIKLLSESNIELEEGYFPFLSNENTAEADISIECIAGLPGNPFENEKLVFEAKNETQKFYSIYKSGSNLGFIIYNQQTNEIQQLATLDETYTHWKIYSELTDENNLLPLKYPMGPIILHYLTVKSDAVMIHASCAFDGFNGRIFTGFSGAGKSTISKIWADAGNLIVNDDRLIIRKRENDFYVHNTPMYYQDVPKAVPLNSIFLISHSPQNKIKKLSGALAVSKVLAFCIQNNFDKKIIHNHLEFLSELCTHISVYELGFVPDSGVVNFIKANETGGIK
jgi:hypothetical protein